MLLPQRIPPQPGSPSLRTTYLMCSEDMTGSGSGSSYSNRMRDMPEYLPQEWITPDSSQFMPSHDPFVSNLNQNTSLPTPISLSNTAYLDPQQSPVAGTQAQELQYHQYIDQMSHHGLGISTPSNIPLTQPIAPGYEHHHHHQEPVLRNPFTAPIEQPRPRRGKRADSTATSTRRRSTPVSIAPNPAGIQQLEAEKRVEQEMEASQSNSSSRRRSSTKRRFSQLAAETEFVKELRDQNVPWKEIVERFEARFGIECSQARLQMRNTRLRQRMQEWAEDDIRALQNAHEYWEKAKFEIISEKMLEFGASERFSALQCEQKWRELHSRSTLEDDDPGLNPPRKRARTS